jgi:hypothetical protein
MVQTIMVMTTTYLEGNRYKEILDFKEFLLLTSHLLFIFSTLITPIRLWVVEDRHLHLIDSDLILIVYFCKCISIKIDSRLALLRTNVLYINSSYQ